jgi:hypothetical protein
LEYTTPLRSNQNTPPGQRLEAMDCEMAPSIDASFSERKTEDRSGGEG